jgi:putative ABC transport system permease protein
MSLLQGLKARVRSIRDARGAESRMEEEFLFHVEMETERLVAEGLSHDEARRRALISFGGMDRQREEMRDGRGRRWLDDVVADVRYALRTMRRGPGFAIAVALTLGVGIGVNGIIFGYVDTMLFRPVPGRETSRLVALFNLDTKSGTPHDLAYEDYKDFRDRSGAFDGLAGMTGIPLNVVADAGAGGGAADMVWGEMVTENYFSVIGMRPALGRFFTAVDAPQGANAFAVLSYASWRRRFRGDSSIVGRVIRINGGEFTITGVAAPGFRGMRLFGFWPEIWVPAGMHDIIMPGSTNLLQGRGGGWLMAFGRMNRGWSIERTQRAAALFAKQLETAYPATNASMGTMVFPGGTGFDHPSFVKSNVLALASAMGLFASIVILLIICANLANLQLARAAARGREIAIRLALGSSRTRLVRQLIVESLVLIVPGLAVGATFMSLSGRFERYMVPHLQFQVGLDARPDARVIAFTAAVALFAGMLFSLAPAVRASRFDIAGLLSNVIGDRRRTSKLRMRVRDALVVSQIAMSVILLVAGTLFVRSLWIARQADVGFDATNRLLVSVNVGLQGYDEAKGRRFYDDVIARVRMTPGVASASWAFPVPFDTYGRRMAFYVEGLRTNAKTPTIAMDVSVVGEDFVNALGLRLTGGREFARTDSVGAPEVMVVSRSLAARLWPGRNPIGQHVRRGGSSGPDVTVIGVVDEAKFATLGDVDNGRAYLTLRQRYRDWQTLVVHTRAEPMTMLRDTKRVIAGVDPMLPAFGATTMTQAVASGLSTSRTAAMVAGFFGSLALLIAAVGLYAVVATGVVERTREIGIRLALGSTPTGVLRFVMRGGGRLGAWGLGIGLFAAFGVSIALSGLLLGLSSRDPLTFAVVPVVLAFVVMIATYLPARRAVKLDPVAALRRE